MEFDLIPGSIMLSQLRQIPIESLTSSRRAYSQLIIHHTTYMHT